MLNSLQCFACVIYKTFQYHAIISNLRDAEKSTKEFYENLVEFVDKSEEDSLDEFGRYILKKLSIDETVTSTKCLKALCAA